MKRLLVAFLASAAVATPLVASAQKLAIQGSGGFGLNSEYARLYNRSTVITFNGKITGKTIASPLNGTGNSVRVIVRATNGGSMLVELGPEWFVEHQKAKLNVGNRVSVTGSKVILDGRGSIMARTVRKGNDVLVLRDPAGNPYWIAQRLATTTTTRTGAESRAQQMADQAARQPVYGGPAVMNGTVDSFFVQDGDVYMVVNVGPSDTQTVYMGPEWYVERQDFSLNPGDIISMNVFTPIPNPDGVVYLQSLTSGANTLVMRNNVGQMNWMPWYPAAWPRRMPVNVTRMPVSP